MVALHNVEGIRSTPSMATRWRRRRMCVLLADSPAPAALRDISGCGAFLETNARPAIGSLVRFLHPEAGAIDAEVKGIARDGIEIAFAGDSGAVAFALTAITTDMTGA